jgi:hypothetical protein
MENGTRVQVARDVFGACMTRLRRIDPEYGTDSLFELMMKHPAVAQALYDAEIADLDRESESRSCGVDSQTSPDSPEMMDTTYDLTYCSYDDVYIPFSKQYPNADANLFVDMVNAVLSAVNPVQPVEHMALSISSLLTDQCYLVANTADKMIKIIFYIEEPDVHFCMAFTTPPDPILESSITSAINKVVADA